MAYVSDGSVATMPRVNHTIQTLPITVDLNGGRVALTIHELAGQVDGPTLAIVSTVHGNEWFYIEVVRRLIAELQGEAVRGTVLLVPVANPTAFGQITRTTPDDSDTPDLNRAFPGRYSSITERLAATIEQEILTRSQYLIQYDCGPWGWAINEVMYGTDYPDPGVVDASHAMAVAYGCPLIRAAKLVTEHPGSRSLSGYAGSTYRLPSILAEIGGSGFDHAIEEGWIEANLMGTKRVMQHLGMLEGPITPVAPQYICPVRARVNPTAGGMLEAHIGQEKLGAEVHKDQLLGLVRDPYTLEVLEELRSPGDGWLFYLSRSKPVRPGDFAMGVILREGAIEVKNREEKNA
ncbi:MAG: succinylglutamate desuccinylase/aspartoacylase family protein [Thermomicrobiales bacterium]|nr:succinylglutamate desuccinylase/aspartoacylase family protein [Thermomicrobiales bacterium]MCO5220640.1 succinylglutamate desuccinylase/aspartoacylase family protein [Thermomicrobiales bacterium]